MAQAPKRTARKAGSKAEGVERRSHILPIIIHAPQGEPVRRTNGFDTFSVCLLILTSLVLGAGLMLQAVRLGHIS